ncbi:MAG: aldehyde dehydrogenase family protein [Pseudomonadota bacterium]
MTHSADETLAKERLLKPARHFIAGEWIGDERSTRGDVFDPANGELVGTYFDGSAALSEQAVDVAHEAFFKSSWAQSPRFRSQVLYEFADRLEAIKSALAEQVVKENGKVAREASHEIDAGISEARYYAGLSRNIFGRMTETQPGHHSLLSREPAGVAAIITPWNAPITLLVRSLGPALAAGCTTVIKPASQTAVSHSMVMRCFDGIENLPTGVVNSVNGEKDVGRVFTTSPKVDVVSFTGSSATGKQIMADAAQTLKRMSLELGGKAPAIIFPDADMNRTVAEITRCSLVHAGQMCVAVARVLVHKDCYNDVCSRLAESFRAHITGDPFGSDTKMGPVINRANQERICGLIEQAENEGNIIVRGHKPDGALNTGSFVTPTLFEIEDVRSTLVQRELFGPIVSLEMFETEDDAIQKANATEFGLAASIWTCDISRAIRIGRAVRAGNVWLNSHMKLMAEAETGGFGSSGLGRLHGEEGLDDFLETKTLFIDANT